MKRLDIYEQRELQFVRLEQHEMLESTNGNLGYCVRSFSVDSCHAHACMSKHA